MATNKIYIPTFISSVNYAPARVLPHIYFYNGKKASEQYFIQGYFNGNTGSVVSTAVDAFPYFDNYEGQDPQSGSRSLLFFNEPAVYGTTPTNSLYTDYWETYISLLYNPRTRLVNCEAIIPLADYFKMELNDIVEWRGNYYHLRAINQYNLSNGECQLQLLGPLYPPVISGLLPVKDCGFTFSSSYVPCSLTIDYLVVAGGGGGGRAGGGGGAGGLISGSLSLSPADEFNITIGLGGTGSTSSTIDGANGNTSSIYNVDTFVSYSALGGGGGGSVNRAGKAGGSGGGASYGFYAAASGTIGQGNPGGASLGNDACGGGGGASQSGENGQSGPDFALSGDGGSGSQWLNGTFYAGGGGGGEINQPVTQQPLGGIGGGGAGGYQSLNPATRRGVDGTVNTGGGAGGGSNGPTDGAGGDGGSGIVIIRYASPTSLATGGTISSSGGFIYHTFTSNGVFEFLGCLTPTTTTTSTTTIAPTTTTTSTTSTTTSTTSTTTIIPTSTTTSTTSTTTGAPVEYQIDNAASGNSASACAGATTTSLVYAQPGYTVPFVGMILYDSTSLITPFIGSAGWRKLTGPLGIYAVEINTIGEITNYVTC